TASDWMTTAAGCGSHDESPSRRPSCVRTALPTPAALAAGDASGRPRTAAPRPPLALTVTAAARLIGLRRADVRGGRDGRVGDVVGHESDVEGGVLAADRAHGGEPRDVLGERHERGERLERAGVEGHAEPGDDDRRPGEDELVDGGDEVHPE